MLKKLAILLTTITASAQPIITSFTQWETNGIQWIVYSITNAPPNSDMFVEVSGDLSNWTAASIDNNTGLGYGTYTNSIGAYVNVPIDQRYFRLMIEQQPVN